MSKVVNSAAGNTYFGVDGNALSSQPTLDKTTVAGRSATGSDTRAVEVAVDPTLDAMDASRAIFGYLNKTDAGAVDTFGQLGAGTFGSNLEITFLSAPSPAFYVGELVVTNQDKVLTVVAISGTSPIFDIDFADASDYITGTGGSGLLYRLPKDADITSREGKYTVLGSSDEVAGSSNTAILSGATGKPRDVNNREAVRTVQTTSAIRAGHWDESAGEWTTEPTGVNDTTLINPAIDKAHAGPERITFQDGGPDPSTLNL